MKLFVYILVILVLASCKNSSSTKVESNIPENSKFITTKLIDSLGIITCAIPKRYDTFFHWTNLSDCGKPCEKEEYRYQPKEANITRESGFICNCDPTDSVEQFTIYHSGWFEFRDLKDTNYILKVHPEIVKSLTLDSKTRNRISSDTVMKINDRYFSIVIIDSYLPETKQYLKKVLTATTIKGNGIHFDYELLTKKKDSTTEHFINNSLQLLKTIKISNSA